MSAQTQSAAHASSPARLVLTLSITTRYVPPPIALSSLLLALLALSLEGSCEGCVLHHEIEMHLSHFQPLPHSSAKTPGCHQERFFNSSILSSAVLLPATPLESALTDEHRVSPCFGRNCPSASSLESTLTRSRAVTPLEATLTRN